VNAYIQTHARSAIRWRYRPDRPRPGNHPIIQELEQLPCLSSRKQHDRDGRYRRDAARWPAAAGDSGRVEGRV
jgi:hypothetical protein